MKCKNCNEEMGSPIGKEYKISWCSNCGTVLFKECECGIVESWLYPKSVQKTKELVSELVKAKDKNDLHIQVANKKDREHADSISWGYDDER